MKIRFVLVFLSLFSSASNAQEIFAEFEISGQFTDNLIQGLRVEVDTAGQFMGAHGALDLAGGTSVPASGTCFVLATGGIFCTLNADHMTFTVQLTGNRNGAISARDSNGVFVDTAFIELVDIYQVP